MTFTQIADEIRTLQKRSVGNAIHIGRLLTEGREALEHGAWYPWLRDEFAWSRQTADRYIGVYELSLKTPNLGDLKLDISTLYLLAEAQTPPDARAQIIEIARDRGIVHKDAKQIVRDARCADEAKSAPIAPPSSPPTARDEGDVEAFQVAIATLADTTRPVPVFVGQVSSDRLQQAISRLEAVLEVQCRRDRTSGSFEDRVQIQLITY